MAPPPDEWRTRSNLKLLKALKWSLSAFTRYDLGYFDLEQKTLQPLDNPFGTRLSAMS